MEPRLNCQNLAPAVPKTMLGVEAAIRPSGLEETLVDLAKRTRLFL